MAGKPSYETLRKRVKALEKEALERKSAEEALRESEERLRYLTEATFEGIVIHDKGTILKANDQFFRMFGYEPSELMQKQALPIVIASESMEAVKKQIDSGLTGHYEATFIRKDGTKVPVEIHAKPLTYEGRVVRVAALRDITARKQIEGALRKTRDELERRVEERTTEVVIANELLRREVEIRKRSEEALRESQSRYKELWDDAPVAYHTLNNQGIITHVNQTEARMLGYNKREMVGKPIFDFILSEQRADAEKRFRQKLAGEDVPKHDNRVYVKKDGTRIYVVIDDVFEYGSDNEVLNVRSTMVDITERKLAEQALRRVNRALRVLSHCNEALIRAKDEMAFMDEVCRIIVEDGGYRLAWVGFAEKDAGKTVRPVAQKGFGDGYLVNVDITWADTERGRGPTGTAIRSKKPSIARDILTDPHYAPWRKAAAERGYASSIALPLVSDGTSFGALNIYGSEPEAFSEDEVKLLFNLAQDLSYGITALRARAKLRLLSSQLLKVQESERKRISRELHDSIGQSLAAIKFGAENVLTKMREGANQASISLLDALIPLVQNASAEVRRIHTDLRPSLLDDLGIIATISWFCREFEKLYSGLSIEKQINVHEKDVPDNLKIVIFRILQEALNNVAKYGKADLVRVALEGSDEQMELVITDNGQGFDLNQARSETVLEGGFGLTSMKERAELSGGVFSIKSAKGKGTTVRASWKHPIALQPSVYR
jgi:PAS domain S-box-containing protein